MNVRRAAAKTLHYLAAVIGFIGGLLVIVSTAIEHRAVAVGQEDGDGLR